MKFEDVEKAVQLKHAINSVNNAISGLDILIANNKPFRLYSGTGAVEVGVLFNHTDEQLPLYNRIAQITLQEFKDHKDN